MDDNYEFRVNFMRGNIDIGVYVTLPATEFEAELETDGLTEKDSRSVIYWAKDALLVEARIDIYVPEWDWEIEALS